MQQKFEGSVGAVTSDTIEIQHQHNGNVFVLNTGLAASNSDDNNGVRAWREFVDLTKIPASATACRFLRILLETEDVTPQQINRLWGRELRFHRAIGLQVAVPRRPHFAITVIGIIALLGCGISIDAIFRQHTAFHMTAFGLCTFFLGGFFWVSIDLLVPYAIAKKVQPMLHRVNAYMGLEGDDK